MDKKEKFQTIKEKTNDFLNTINRMESSEIKQIDIDSLRLKIATIYDEILSLTSEQNTEVDMQQETAAPQKEILPESETKVEEPIAETPAEAKKEEPEQPAKPEQSEELNLNFTDPEQDKNPVEKQEEPYVPKIEFVRENNSVDNGRKTIGESFQGNKTLNDLMTEIKNEAGTGLNFLKVDNLMHAISINDKIEFVRELFANNTDKYAETVKKINEEKDLDSAIFILTDLDFDNENPTAKKFLNLVYRRFMEE